MRVLLITRILPRSNGPTLEARIHDRIRELSELGHDVLVLTRWTGDAIDLNLPERVEVRFPFKKFVTWEWPTAMPLALSWRPDVLHVIDPGLKTIERAFSAESTALRLLEALKFTSRSRIPYQGGLVSILSSNMNPDIEETWQRAGAQAIDRDWLAPRESRKKPRSWDEAGDRALRLVLLGQVGQEVPFQFVLDALEFMLSQTDFYLSVFLDRSRLSKTERRLLAHAERRLSADRPHIQRPGFSVPQAVGSRLVLLNEDPESPPTLPFDAALALGFPRPSSRFSPALRWLESFPLPTVVSEGLAIDLSPSHAVLGTPVSEVAAIAQALNLATNRDLLRKAWSQIESGALNAGRDVAANHLSRLYSKILDKTSTAPIAQSPLSS